MRVFTGHVVHRDRTEILTAKKFGDQGYAMEELVAEVDSPPCVDLRIMPEVHEDHASFIESWLKVVTEVKWAVFSGPSHGAMAADFLIRRDRDDA